MIRKQSPIGFRKEQLHNWVWNDVANPVYSRTGTAIDVDQILNEVKTQFTNEDREVLYRVISDQYAEVNLTSKESEQLKKIKDGAFVVTTGQQLHPFLGPVFVWNKIFTAIETANWVEDKYGVSVVPIFWMASEDHDFEEVKHIPFLGRSYEWKNNQNGSVGRMKVDGIVDVCDQILLDFHHDSTIVKYFTTFRQIYSNSNNMAEATRKVLHFLMGDVGIIALDPDSKELKELAVDLWISELTDENFQALTIQNKELRNNNISVLVNPRRTQLFKLTKHDRQRIDKSEDGYQLKNGESLSTEELKQLIAENPECISPNVLLRPIYQQKILPNIAYVAGPSEYYYWLELTQEFYQNHLTLPWLVLRSGSLFLPNSAKKKIQKLGLEIDTLYYTTNELSKVVLEKIEGEYTLDLEVNALQVEFEKIWKSLFKAKTEGLKDLKKKHQNIVKELLHLSNSIKTGESLNTEKKNLLEAILKVKHEFFNPQKPQERIDFYIDWLVKGVKFPTPGNSITAFIEL
ncbi:MAG: bacillithiol biosynthesis cysteine-adding enzyme BshC [Bacteroidia bacterium]